MYLTKYIFTVCYAIFMCFAGALATENDRPLYAPISQPELTPRLEDFFWTGSGDGPPPPLEHLDPTPVQPTPVVLTTTVLATVYLDSYPPQAVTDKTGECISNCGEPVIPSSLEPEIPDDRRYWLLTVIQGSTPDSLQLRLARLYQKAFLRQQEKHLGIIKSLDAPTARRKHEVQSFKVNRDSGISPTDLEISSKDEENVLQVSHKEEAEKEMEVTLYPANIEMFPDMNNAESTNFNDLQWVLVTPMIRKREATTDNEELLGEEKTLLDDTIESETNGTSVFKREIIKPDQQPPVYVHIQNITESSTTGSVEIVYVVLVGGRAVPAAVAARDMRLVRDAEVATELGAVVTTKAEPAYLKALEGLAGETEIAGIHGAELWALVVGATVALLLVVVLLALFCRLARRKKKLSAASLSAYRNEMIREMERNQMKQVHEVKDGRLISVVSPSRTRPSSSLLPVYRAGSATSSSTTSSGVSEMAAALRRRQKKPHALKISHKKRVGTTDSLLEAAGVESSDSGKDPSVPNTPTSYLSMPSIKSFPRGNLVEPLSRVLEPISVRHLDIDSPIASPKRLNQRPDQGQEQRRQMSSQLVRLGSIDKDPGVIGPLVWDLHRQMMKDSPKHSPALSVSSVPRDKDPGLSRMRQRFNELVDDAFSLFGSPNSSPKSAATFNIGRERNIGTDPVIQARNDNVKLPSSQPSDSRGQSAGVRIVAGKKKLPPSDMRPRTSFNRQTDRPPTRAWDTPPHSLTSSSRLQVPTVNPSYILSEGNLPPTDPALPLISAIKSEIEKVRENAQLHKPI